MTKRRDRRPKPLPAGVPPRPSSDWVLDAAAVAVGLLCVALAWASRGNLNVDGVAYLDLADRLRSGDWTSFVQGYWSPAYPALLAIVLTISGTSGSDAATAAHFLNLLIALGAIGIVWRAARRRGAPVWGVMGFTAILVSGARTLRIDAVTPDLLLLAMLAGFAVELVRPEGWRGHRLGVWAGAAFLAKTSVWPWLVVVGLVGFLVARREPSRRAELAKAVAMVLLPLALWAGGVSSTEGRPTISTTGRLSACWYLLSCDGRTPDSHQGAHEDYHTWILSADATAKVATFGGSQWTYAPWSDPSAWQRRLVNQRQVFPTVAEFAVYVAKQAGLVIGVWLPLLVLTVLLPAWLGTRHAPPMLQVLRRPAGVAMFLGVVGVLQFVAVHAEPRLIAPFVLLFATGWITWRDEGVPAPWLRPAALGALSVALAIGTWHLRDQSLVTAGSTARAVRLEGSHPAHAAPHRVAVVGPALPLMPDLYRARAEVVAQVMEPDPAALEAWPSPAQAALAVRLRELGATALWISRGRTGYSIAPIPPIPLIPAP